MENIKPMSGSEVSRFLGITRQTVSATTKRALGKMYYIVQEKGIADNPFDAMLALMAMCNISDGVVDDVQSFITLFPSKIQDEVKASSPTKY